MVFRRVDTAKPSFKCRHRASSVHVAHAASRFESTWKFAFRSALRTSRRRRRGDARSDGHHRSSRGRVPHRASRRRRRRRLASSASSAQPFVVAVSKETSSQYTPKNNYRTYDAYYNVYNIIFFGFVCFFCIQDDVIHVRLYCLHIHVIRTCARSNSTNCLPI